MRFLLFLLFCYSYLVAQQLPLDFSNTNQTFVGFDGSSFAYRGAPDDGTNQVGQFFNNGLNENQGFYISLSNCINLREASSISLSFYSFDPNVHKITMVLQNLEDQSNVLVTKTTASRSGWQHNINFSFQEQEGVYDRLFIYIDIGVKTPGTYLIDNINNGTVTDTTSNNEEETAYDVLVWSDDFDSGDTKLAVDNSKWHHQIFPPSGNGSWFNGEEQHYTNRTENSFIKNGFLHIVAKKESYSSFGTTKSFTSARLNSKFAFTYGRVDVRAKLPNGNGTWPAIWTLGKNIIETGAFWTNDFGNTPWPSCGEIDIMEHGLGPKNHTSSAIHTPSSFGNTINTSSQILLDVANIFYKYSMIWSPNKIVFLVDDIPYYTYNPSNKNRNNWPFTADQYLLLNVAMGGFAGSIEPVFTEAEMVIDYVRVYQSEAVLSTQSIANKNVLVELYPNPIKDKLFIKTSKNIKFVEIYNTIGKKVFLQKYNTKNTTLNLSGFTQGIHFLKITTETKTLLKKIIVQ